MAARGTVAASIVDTTVVSWNNWVYDDVHTFERYILRYVKGTMLPANCIFSVAPTRGKHLVKSSDTIARLKFCDIISDCMNYSSDVISLVYGRFNHFCTLLDLLAASLGTVELC